ncbi:hypothetical protein EXU57_16970 [Segetibacter sp. 3557_3]|uniref:hypothetical protein n=1 Tax=Segetibacter sp. 3557_3 TaxID=2547429 RepID=UPI00105848C9|nr:hypothetical protein [Segetibacter sp. 3557_3]TDH23494.1 hypothetical protein EXU57_16970 [Segetibacter sp. 3557_3]
MRHYLLLVVLLLSLLKTGAQDAVAVSKEPLHKNVFENRYVRALELHIAPGDTTMFHKHEKPCVSISLHPVRTGSQTLLDDKGPRVQSADRRITFDGFYQSPRIHRVWNRDSEMFHWMDVEILTSGNRVLEEPMAAEGIKQVFDAPPVRAYLLTLKGKQKMSFKRNAPFLIVSLSQASTATVNKHHFSRQGDFLFVKPSKKIRFSNNSDTDYSLAVLELK